jgi:hypothetical protein
MQKGQLVTVHDAWGNKLKRTIVAISNGKVYVCTREEFTSAMRESRDPKAVGFPVEDIVSCPKVSLTPKVDSR